MAGLVEEIQRDALNPAVAVTTILRKVKVAASKLGLGNVEEWVENELNGYTGKIPKYRELVGSPQAFNPYQGWIPILLNTDEQQEFLARCPVHQSISAVEDLVARSSGGFVEMKHPPAVVRALNQGSDFELGRMSNHLAITQVQAIVDAVRNQALEWALQLERSGISGEGFSFNAEERAIAKESPVTYNIGTIGNFAGNMGQGNTSGDIILNVANWSELRKFADQVEAAIPALQADGADISALSTAVSEIKREIAKLDPDRPVIRGLLTDVRNAVSGAAGSLIASGIVAQVASLLGS